MANFFRALINIGQKIQDLWIVTWEETLRSDVDNFNKKKKKKKNNYSKTKQRQLTEGERKTFWLFYPDLAEMNLQQMLVFWPFRFVVPLHRSNSDVI